MAGAHWGPERLPSALVLTFDNLGEASELERGSFGCQLRDLAAAVLPARRDAHVAAELVRASSV